MTDEEKKEPEGGRHWSGRLLVIRLVLWALVACFVALVVLGKID